MDARESVIFALAWKAKHLAFAGFVNPLWKFGAKNILQTIAHLTQYTLLEIQFWSVKHATVTV